MTTKPIDDLNNKLIKEREQLAVNHALDMDYEYRYAADNDFKAGHEAATERLLPILERAMVMAEFYGDENNQAAIVIRISTPVGQLHDISSAYKNDAGEKAREFQAFLAELTKEQK